MASTVQHVGETIQCAHFASVTVSSSTRVTVGGRKVATVADTFMVSGCPNQVGTKKQPCVQVKWMGGARRVRAGGQAVLLQDSTGICQSAEQIAQGTPNVISTQQRVKGT
jgi:hypothetical protein